MGDLKILGLMNAFVSVSGSDVRFIEIMKRIPKTRLVVVTSSAGSELCVRRGLNAEFKITTNEKSLGNICYRYFLRTLRALAFKIKLAEIDLVYGSSDFFPDVIPAFFWKVRHRHVCWQQCIHHFYANPFKRVGNNFSANVLGYLSQKISFYLIQRYADLVIVVNPLIKRELMKIGFDENKLKIIPNGIDSNYLKKIKKPETSLFDGVFLGRLNKSKGLYELVEIWTQVLKQCPLAKLAIIGEGDAGFKSELSRKIQTSGGQDAIKILGFLESAQAFEIIKSSKVFVFPSFEEGFGIVIMEALACGVPVVTWDLPVYGEIFSHGVIKIPIGDIHGFADAIFRILNAPGVSGLSNQEVETLSSEYSWEKVAAEESAAIFTMTKNLHAS